MPGSSGGGSVVAANPSLVMPWTLARAFQRQQQYAVDRNDYANGETQPNALTTTSRKQWKLTFPLTSSQKTALLSFFNSVAGGLNEFIFYDVLETDPQFSYDVTGSALDGRYSVRFDGPWQSAFLSGSIAETDLALIEVS